ncbi:MAG: hypothetical protein KA735_02055 [Burkholderiaceae bacterium]|nr:hypothetical protein [Burkholderiaceae bacterium]
MLNRSRLLSRPSLLGLALSACLIAPLALAAGSTDDSSNNPEQRYQADVQLCNSGQGYQDKATCMKEAGAALEEARRNRLTTGERLSAENQTKRCEALPGQERDDCMVQMSGQNTTTEGSIEAGGVLRETTITTQGPVQTQPAPSLTPAPVISTEETPHSPYLPAQPDDTGAK